MTSPFDDIRERHYTTAELAEMLQAHEETIRRAARKGHLRSVRLGRDRRYSATAVKEWLESIRDQRGAAV